MKRYLAVFLSVLLLLPVTALPAMADTSYELVFYPDGSISTFMVISGESYIAVTDFMIPDGYYHASLRLEVTEYFASYGGDLFFVLSGLSSEPIYFERFSTDEYDYFGQSSFFDCLAILDQVIFEGHSLPLVEFSDFANNVLLPDCQIKALSDAPDTFCYYLSIAGEPFEWSNPELTVYLTLEPVSTSSSIWLSDLVSGDTLNVVMFQILGLLPVALVTVVGFFGIRKGIAFIRRLLGYA